MPNGLEQMESCSFVMHKRNTLAGCFGILVCFINHPVESLGTNELVFFVRRRPVFTPRISFVEDYFPLLDHLFRMLECCLV